MNKHTPGPWWVKQDGSIESISGTVGQICQIGLPREQTANAHLIASAPDLLAALEEFFKVNSGFNNIGWPEKYHQAIKMAGEALAKAKS